MKINGEKLFEMLHSAANLLEREKDDINALNVFPVPDGDTGSNMSMTMAGVREISLFPGDGVGDCAGKASGKMLRSARGNSGVILSLFFKGFAKSLAYLTEADAADIGAAFRGGVDCAYQSVMNPTEGTILTVMRACAEDAEAVSADYADNLCEFFRRLLKTAEEALASTPDLLPVLKSANVVDAGGCGFTIVLRGMLACLEGKPVQAVTSAANTQSRADFSAFSTETITFPYCTECILDKKEELLGEGSAGQLREFLAGIGDSLVFVDDEEIIKLHVHTGDPGKVLSKALEFGTLATVKVENMRLQHTELASADGRTDQEGAATETAKEPAPLKPYGFVCVAAGDGIAATFRDIGADEIIEGGQTMNPSMGDLLRAIEKVPAEVVYVLPNNNNIYMAACQAAGTVRQSSKTVYVLPSRSIPEGISAMLAFDETRGSDTNFKEMKAAVGAVCSIALTYAAHDSHFEGKAIKEGQILGLVDGKVRYITDTRKECVCAMESLFQDSSYITVFYGAEASREEAKEIRELLSAFSKNAEIVVIDGGQPVYSYLISVE